MKVLFHGSVRDHTSGEASFDPGEALDVRRLIEMLGERFGGPFREFLTGDQNCFFLVNGSGTMMTGGYDTPLKNSDTAEILPFVDGG